MTEQEKQLLQAITDIMDDDMKHMGISRYGFSPASRRFLTSERITELARFARGRSPNLDYFPELRPTEISVSSFILPREKKLEVVGQGLVGIIMRNLKDARDTSLVFLRGVKIGLGGSISHDNITNLLIPGASKGHANIVFDGPNPFIVANDSTSLNGQKLEPGAKYELNEKSILQIADHVLSVVCLRGKNTEPPSVIQHPGNFAILEIWDLRYGRRNLAVVSGESDDQIVFKMDGSCASIIPNNNVTGFNAAIKFEKGALSIRDFGRSTQIDGNICDYNKWLHLKEGQVVHIGRFNVAVVNAIHMNPPKIGGVFTPSSLGYCSLEIFLRNPAIYAIDSEFLPRIVRTEAIIYRSFAESDASNRSKMLLRWVKLMESELKRIATYSGERQGNEYQQVMASVEYLMSCGSASTDPASFFNFIESNRRHLDLAIAAKRLTKTMEKAPVFEKVESSWKIKALRSAIIRCMDEKLNSGEQLTEIVNKIPENLMGETKPEELHNLIHADRANNLQEIELLNKILNPLGLALWTIMVDGKRRITLGEVTHIAHSDDGDTVIVKPIKKLTSIFTAGANMTRAGIQLPLHGTIMLNGEGKSLSHDKSFRFQIQKYLDELTGLFINTTCTEDSEDLQIEKEALALAASYYYSELKAYQITDALEFQNGGKVRAAAGRRVLDFVRSEGGNVKTSLIAFINKRYKDALGVEYSSLINRHTD